MSNIKFDVKNLNLHYGKFHALKYGNTGKTDYSIYRTFRMR